MKIKELLKSIFSLTTILQCYISAIGYGLGYIIPDRLNLGMGVSIVSCLVFGSIFDWLANLILNSKVFKENNRRKILLAIALYILYLASWLVGDRFFGYDLDYDFISNVEYTIFFQILAFVIEFIKDYRKKKKEA